MHFPAVRERESKCLAPFILPISSTIPVCLVQGVDFAGLLSQSDLGRQLQQTLHILED